MGLRETLNQNPGITTIGIAVIIVVAVGLVVMSLIGGEGSSAGPSNKAWFSDDDGNSWFADDRSKIPPFDHKGKQAVRAHVYTCDGGKTKFVGWLERYTPEGKKQLEAQRARFGDSSFALESEGSSGVREIKKPKTGDKGWVNSSDASASSIIDVKCPDGTTDTLELAPDP